MTLYLYIYIYILHTTIRSLKCVPGQYQLLEKQKNCSLCKIGTFSNLGQKNCSFCKIGFFSNLGQASCQVCGAGSAGTGCNKCVPGKYRGNDDSETVCISCKTGQYSSEYGAPFCLHCGLGTFASDEQQTKCSACEKGKMQESRGEDKCIACKIGKYTAEDNQAGCQLCDVGKYANSTQQTECSDCEAGFFQNSKGQSSCKSCLAGQYSAEKSSSICVECDAGMYSLLNTTVCAKCPIGLYEKEKGSAMCRKCKNGKVPTIQQTECENPRWTVVNDCLDYTEYFNSTDPDYTLWSCVDCPIGANCFDEINRKVLNWYDVRAKQGYWRVPWSTVNWSKVPVVFVKCPYFKDCVGWSVDSGIANATESCLLGTKGPLCSKCVEGYTRDTVRCTRCSNESFGIRVGIVIVSLILISIITTTTIVCRHRFFC